MDLEKKCADKFEKSLYDIITNSNCTLEWKEANKITQIWKNANGKWLR